MRNPSNKSAAASGALVWSALLILAGGAAAWETLRDRGPAREPAAAVAPAQQIAAAPPAPPAALAPPAPAVQVEPAHMSPAMQAAFDAWLIEAYKQCWTPPKATPQGDPYLPRVRVAFKADGALAAPPKLINPPLDPDWKAHAEAAMRAVKACDPLHVPEKYGPYYLQWKTKTVYFDSARP